MEHLTQRDFRALLEFLRGVYGISNLQTLVAHILKGILRLVPADLTVYCEMNLRTTNSVNWEEPRGFLTPQVERNWERVMHEHPMFTHHQRTRDGRAHTISDFLSRYEYHRLPLYNEFYRPLGVEEDINLFLSASSPMFIGISLHRGWRRFSARDRLLLNLVRPHLTQAWRNAKAFTGIQERRTLVQQTLDRLDRGAVLIDRAGQVRLVTQQARHWLSKYFGGTARKNSRLPEELERWIRSQQPQGRDREVAVPRRPFVLERKGSRLVVRLLTDPGRSLLFLEEEQTNVDPSRFESLGLTRRETEVIAWVAEGKTNPEIATILSLSSRTVQKHLEHIFQKLGVETRTAAAARALATANDHSQ